MAIDSASTISQLREVASAHPELFPNLVNLAGRDGLYVRTTLSPMIPASVWEELQISWIENSPQETFLAAFSAKQMIRVSSKVSQAIDRKILGYVTTVLDTRPELFPTVNGLLGLNLPHITSTLFWRIPKATWSSLQLDWIETSSDASFVTALSASAMRTVSPVVNRALNKRLLKIVEKDLHENPGVFPSTLGLSKLSNLPARHLLHSRIPNQTLEKLQLRWVKKSTEEHFLVAFSTNSFSQISDAVTAAVNQRLLVIVKKTMRKHPEVFPTCSSLAQVDGLPCTTVLAKRIPKAVLDEIQSNWVENSSEKNFLAAFSNSSMTSVSEPVQLAIDGRLRDIYVSHLSTGRPLPKLGKSTFSSHVVDFDDLRAIHGIFTGQRSPDQQLVSKIGLRVAERESWVHSLMEKRLEQLWFFRELAVLAFVGYADNSTVVSFSHETLPIKLQKIFPAVQNVQHVFLENLEDGTIKPLDRTILLSVFQWLSQPRLANLIRNLSLSTSPGHEVVFTYPQDHTLLPDAVDNLAKLGFELVRLGELRLTPHATAQEPEKLEQFSRVGVMRRTSGVPAELASVDLFFSDTSTPSSIQSTNILARTYKPKDLVDSHHSVVLHSSDAHVGGFTKPQLVEICSLPPSFILTFAGGEIAGFDMHPSKRGTVEIEGSPINYGVIQATFALLKGATPTLDIADSMRENYRAFVASLKTRTPNVAETRIRRVK
ncbi:MAG: hypothetical protein ABH842_00575 [Candidatus Micrarchaeota archaeon]